MAVPAPFKVTLPGETDIEKSPAAGAFTVSVTLAVWESDPLVPVTTIL
jgi:hypothetical protein